mgnify:CR=1 FL=1
MEMESLLNILHINTAKYRIEMHNVTLSYTNFYEDSNKKYC